MSQSTREKIIAMLGHGVPQVVVADAVGVTESYISQLLEREEVRAEVLAAKSDKLQAYLETDAGIEDSERKALRLISKKLDSPLVSLTDATKTFAVLNAARKKSEVGAAGTSVGAVDMVTFILPRAAKVMIQINSDNQVTEVDGRTTAPLPSRALPGLAARLEMQKQVETITSRMVPAREQVPVARATNPSPQELPPHVEKLRERTRAMDESRARAVLADITTVIDGVAVVI